MSEILENFNGTAEARGFTPAPAGRYLSRLIDVNTEGETAEGHMRWGLRFEFAAQLQPNGTFTTVDPSGAWCHKGAWDNLVQSERAKPRRLLQYRRLGIDCDRPFALTPQLLLGRWAILDVEIDTYTDRDGKPRKTNRVTYDGYEMAPAALVAQISDAGKAPQVITPAEKAQRLASQSEKGS